jgi:hypothetical protein
LALALLAATFLVGGSVGWGLNSWMVARQRKNRDPQGLLTYLTKQLDLSAVQQDSIRSVLARHRQEMDSIWQATRPGIDSLRSALKVEIQEELTPVQQVRFRELMAWYERQRRVADSTNQEGWDADHDGVPYWTDRCPGTPKDMQVDSRGCPTHPGQNGGK